MGAQIHWVEDADRSFNKHEGKSIYSKTLREVVQTLDNWVDFTQSLWLSRYFDLPNVMLRHYSWPIQHAFLLLSYQELTYSPVDVLLQTKFASQ